MSKKNEDSYIDDFKEWQKNQFNPGHYTGGKKHPSIQAAGNPGREAITWFICAGALLLIYFVTLIPTIRGNATNVWGDVVLSRSQTIMISSAIFLPIVAFSVWIGIAYCRKAKKLKEKRKGYKNHIGPVRIGIDKYDKSGMPQIKCSSCGFEFDFDYPKCPHCKYPV